MAFAGDSSVYLTDLALSSRSLQQTREHERASLVEAKSAAASYLHKHEPGRSAFVGRPRTPSSNTNTTANKTCDGAPRTPSTG
jgi:hypothetical protein